MVSLYLSAHRGKTMWGRGKKIAISKPGRLLSPETNPDNTLALDRHPPELWENKHSDYSISL